MSDYNGNDIWNKYVFSSRLNESTDGALLMLTCVPCRGSGNGERAFAQLRTCSRDVQQTVR